MLWLCFPELLFPQTNRAVARPEITGLSHVAIYVDDVPEARKFYDHVLGLVARGDRAFDLNATQSVELEEAPKGVQNRIAHVAFLTTSAEGMRRYLKAKGIAVPDAVGDGRDGAKWFAITDPVGQPIEFIEEKPHVLVKPQGTPPPSRQIIHVGFIVRDRAAEEHFYKEILGFRPYWHGGMTPERTEWVALQVPDGTFWIEEMLGGGDNPSAKDRGVLNHFSLGVEKITSVVPVLQERGWKPAGDDQSKPQMGKDGKWQLNIYDPDLTRVEFMEFRPAEKPCCSAFTGPHPHD